MNGPEPIGDIAAAYLANLWHRPEGTDMTTTLDPGKATRTIRPHPGDASAQTIRALLARVDEPVDREDQAAALAVRLEGPTAR